jgi:hypothetical protein
VTAFAIDIGPLISDGKLALAIEVDGRLPETPKPRFRPAGVDGILYLQAQAAPVATQPLAGPWQAMTGVNIGQPAQVGQEAKYVYLETRFDLPERWPAQRLFLESPEHLGWIILNNKVIQTPGWMRSLDITGLVRRDGANVLRWVPSPQGRYPNHTEPATRTVPPLSIAWRP